MPPRRQLPHPQNTGVAALRMVTMSDSDWAQIDDVPRLWSTTSREVAHACGVSERAVSKWLAAQATPDEPKQAVLEQRFHIKRCWWREPSPRGLGELFVMAIMLGLISPDAELRAELQKAYGIPIDSWDQPAA